MARILIVSTDVVDRAMAGPGIRALELARVLSVKHSVTLAVPRSSQIQPLECTIVPYIPGKPGALLELLDHVDIVIGQGFVFESHPELLASDLPMAIDLYDPLILESLDLYAEMELPAAQAQHQRYHALTAALLRRGDFFFCATETQRDYWLGALTTAGRITPDLVRTSDRDLRALIDLVPSGIAEYPPIAQGPVLRGVHPSVGMDDIILLWAGGLWDWFDPCILVRAMAVLQKECPHVKLCFFAGARPNPDGEPFRPRAYQRAHTLAQELGVLNQSVIFLDQWIEYEARGAYLSEADIGVSAHMPGVETRMAFRTRLLDYLWARLPVVCSAGDSLGEEIARSGAGLLVPPADLSAWITTLRRLCDNAPLRATCRAAAERLSQQYLWREVARPLATFCESPYRTTPTRSTATIVAPTPRDEPAIATMPAIKPGTDSASLVASLSWYHTMNLGSGIVTPGAYDHRPYLHHYGLPDTLHGKQVLDIGAASGFFSFEFEQRGADVTATDLPEWNDHDFGPNYQPDQSPEKAHVYLHRPFDVARYLLGSRVKKRYLNIYDIAPDTVGMFDLVFCGSLLIHLTDPLKALWNMARVTRDKAIIATVITTEYAERSLALMEGYQRGDSWWVPSRTGLELMAACAGFVGIEWKGAFYLDYSDGSRGPYHGVLHAYKTTENWGPDTVHRNTLIEQYKQRPPTPDTAALLARLQENQQQLQHYQSLVAGYEQGRFIRFMRWFHWLRNKIRKQGKSFL